MSSEVETSLDILFRYVFPEIGRDSATPLGMTKGKDGKF
jgi:hypothetical protein